MNTHLISAKALGLTCLTLLVLLALPARAEPPRVVASIMPIHSLAAGVMAGVAEPELLLKGGESPHSFTLRPSDVRKLGRAELVIWVGEALETPLSDTLEATADPSADEDIFLFGDRLGLDELELRTLL